MNKLYLENYDLKTTLFSGQTFSWDFINETFIGITQDKVMKLKLKGEELFWQTYPEKDDFAYIEKYLRLNDPYLEIIEAIKKDQHIISAIEKYPNLRLLKHEFEHSLLSFILASNKNIKAIRRSIRILSKKFGEKIEIENKTYYLFPKAEAFYNASPEQLKDSGIGYRIPYLKDAAKFLVESDLKEKVPTMNENEARNELKKIHGVGDKIADCVLTFGLGFNNVTPLDLWSFKAMKELYKKRDLKYEKIRKWMGKYFEGNAAFAGQFLFEYIRSYNPENYMIKKV